MRTAAFAAILLFAFAARADSAEDGHTFFTAGFSAGSRLNERELAVFAPELSVGRAWGPDRVSLGLSFGWLNNSNILTGDLWLRYERMLSDGPVSPYLAVAGGVAAIGRGGWGSLPQNLVELGVQGEAGVELWHQKYPYGARLQLGLQVTALAGAGGSDSPRFRSPEPFVLACARVILF